jgi:hypothetical protein
VLEADERDRRPETRFDSYTLSRFVHLVAFIPKASCGATSRCSRLWPPRRCLLGLKLGSEAGAAELGCRAAKAARQTMEVGA